MDQFTQSIYESAQNRSKKLGISNMSKVPLTESNVKITTPTSAAAAAAHDSIRKSKPSSASPSKRRQSSSTDRKPSTTTSSSLSSSPSIKNRAVALRSSGSSLMESKNTLNIDAKENDVAVEINITTGPNVQVQVEVEEQEIDGDGNVLNSIKKQRKQIITEEIDSVQSLPAPPSTPYMRDSSRNQLHRLGALYSNPQALSSPVHRTETAFAVEQMTENQESTQSGAKFKKSHRLAELANSINKWEDDIPHESRLNQLKGNTDDQTDANIAGPSSPGKSYNNTNSLSGIRPITKSPRKAAINAGSSILSRIESIELKENDENKNSNNKQLKWDKSIMDSLESQGYKRRDTTTKRLEYDFNAKSPERKATNTSTNTNTKVLNMRKCSGAIPKTDANRELIPAAKKPAEVAKGLVSGRAAIFETQRTNNATTSNTVAAACAGAQEKNKKDPAEMTLKERMALFEKNKGQALIPKAALGMAPSVRQIMADKKPSENIKQVITTPQQPIINTNVTPSVAPSSSKINNFNKAVKADTCATGSGIRQTVAKLITAPATISESRIADENRKLRQQEMNVVLNRFNQQQQQSDDDDEDDNRTPASPPPAPPMPEQLFKSNSGGRKRLSDENSRVSDQVKKSLKNVKRVKVNPPKSGHAYPALSDIESSGPNTPQQYTPEPPYTDEDNSEQPIIERYLYKSKKNYNDDDDDDEESYMNSDDDISNASDNQERSGRHVHYVESSITSDDSKSSEMDKYLDEAMDSDDDVNDYKNRGGGGGGRKESLKKGTISSTSFSYERKPLNRQPDTIYEDEATNYQSSKFQSPIKSQLTVNPSDDNNSVTLTHTVSFYRRQQTMNSPCIRKVTYGHQSELGRRNDENDDGDHDGDDNNDDDDDGGDDDDNNGCNKNAYTRKNAQSQEDLVQKKIKSLMDSVLIQNQQIAQASNALNTCASTFEFSGSTESVVAEWKLLVATHSRKAALQEVQRLKVERSLRPIDAPKECGRLIVKDIVLPLRDDYVRKVSEEKILGHHLVCLLKYNEHVMATRTYPTLPGLKSVKFPGELRLDNVYADFKITLEIYGMIAQRESLPHEIKYHIKKEKKGVIKTPKGKKAGSNLIMPPAQSPAGPNAVRAPAFAYYGFVIFSLREIQRNSWTLNQVAASDITPLIGTVHMKINCALTVDINHKAFLTMFEDVSGFGAWHRRWCHLHGKTLSFWKYPDDERTKPPIGSLDLSVCEQTKIAIAPREICARLNTLMIELKRPRCVDDEDSMLLQVKGEYTYVRHLLSADTKEERNEWCNVFNKTLALMRAWGNSSDQQRRRSMYKN